jgi:ABC-type bacteriocin/lantibiotic exporter with double-glycine peptidase domain
MNKKESEQRAKLLQDHNLVGLNNASDVSRPTDFTMSASSEAAAKFKSVNMVYHSDNPVVNRTLVHDELSTCDPPNIKAMEKEGSGLKILRAYPARQCGSFCIGLIAMTFGQLGNFAVPGLIGLCVDAMNKGKHDLINKYCLFMFVLVVISGFGVWLRAYTFNMISERIAKFLRYDIVVHLLKKDVAFYDTHKTGDILSRMSSDV